MYEYELFLTVLTLINIYLLARVVRFFTAHKQLIGMAKAMASRMGTRSGQVRASKAQHEAALAAQNKGIKNLFKNVPTLGGLQKALGLSEQEIFTWITDPEIGPKLMRLVEGSTVIIDKVTKWIEESAQGLSKLTEKKKQEEIPMLRGMPEE